MPRWRQQGTREKRAALATLAGEAAAEAALVGAAVAEAEAGLPIPPDLTAAAFFDVDNTMMRGASIFYFARGLAARKFLTSGALASFGWQQLKFRVFGRELSPAAIRTCVGPQGGARPAALHRILRLSQRHPDALAGGHCGRGES